MTAALFQSESRIVRSLQRAYIYYLTIEWVDGNYSILSFDNTIEVQGVNDTNTTETVIVDDPRMNFEFSYVMAPADWTDPNNLINNPNTLTATVALNQTNMLFVGNQTTIIEAFITIYVDFKECRKMNYACFFFTNVATSSYTENNLENNLHCVRLGKDKQCSPRELLYHLFFI